MRYENLHSFENGLNKDINPINQPDGSYKDALNMVNMQNEGNLMSLQNELGNLKETITGDSIPTNMNLIGFKVLESDRILIFTNNSSSQIGILSRSNVYSVKLNDASNELNLNLNNPISIEPKKLFNGHRVINFVDNLNPFGYYDLDGTPPTVGNIFSETRAIEQRTQPVISSTTLIDSTSALFCGTYQFAFRYVTGSNNTLPPSFTSNPIYVGGKENYAGQDLTNSLYDGDFVTVLSNKIVVLNVDNIDLQYSQIQLLAIYYSGDNNTFTAYQYRTFNITSSSMTFNYDGYNNELPLLLEDITELGISYTTAKCVAQKDNRLFYSNLKDIKEKYDLGTLVNDPTNGVRLKYKVNTINSTQNYSQTSSSYLYKGYMRDEIYSFAIGVIYKDGSRSFAYHINNINQGQGANAQQISPGYGYMGVYPNSTGACHKMPNLHLEDHFVDNTDQIRVLGVEYDYTNFYNLVISTYPDFAKNVEGFVFLRQSRTDSALNKSIYAQGIGVDVIQNDFNMDISVRATGDQQYPNLVIRKAPFNGNFVFNSDYGQTGPGGNYSTIVMLDTNNFTGAGTYTRDFYNEELYPVKNLMAFYSPETILDNRVTIPTTNVKLSKEVILKASIANTLTNTSSFFVDYNDAGNTKNLNTSAKVWSFFNYAEKNSYSPTTLDVLGSIYVERNTDAVQPFQSDKTYISTHGEAHMLLNLSATPGMPINTNRIEFTQNSQSGRTGKDKNIPLDGGVTIHDSYNYLFNIKSDVTSNGQYGNVQNSNYYICGYKKFNGTNINHTFGGDTFICKMAVMNKLDYRVKGYNAGDAIGGNREYANFTNPAQDAFSNTGIDLRGLMYFWVESTKNTHMRNDNGIPYYPKTSWYNSLEVDPALAEDPHFYNTQYSFENKTNIFVPKPTNFQTTDGYYTRTIWSEQDFNIGGLGGDPYRVFKINNFYDLPKNTGEIWNTFVFNNTLYLHTPKTLWKTFVDNTITLVNDIGQSYLGTGALFSLPAQQVLTQQGGYGGTISQYAGVNTPYGYIFPDALQGKVFMLNEDGLSNIAELGMLRYFNNNLSNISDTTPYSPSNITLIDNPFNGHGITGGYDFNNNRYLITKNTNVDGQIPFTISLSMYNKKFTSFHSYQPSCYIPIDNDLFTFNNALSSGLKGVYKHNSNNYGSFYNTVYNSSLEFIVNKSPQVQGGQNASIIDTKVMDNLVLYMNNWDSNIIHPLRDNTNNDSILVYNDNQCSGVTKLNYTNEYNDNPTRDTSLVHFKNKEYRIATPLNSVINDGLAIFNADGSLNNANIDQNTLYRDRLKGKYIGIKLTFNNLNNYKLVLNYIKSIMRINYR